jgi:hypothetical protein
MFPAPASLFTWTLNAEGPSIETEVILKAISELLIEIFSPEELNIQATEPQTIPIATKDKTIIKIVFTMLDMPFLFSIILNESKIAFTFLKL